MGFVQIIDYRTSRAEEMEQLGKEWEASIGGRSKARRRVLVQDRDIPGRYLNIVFFDSFDEAMENSNDPTTGEFAAKMGALADGPPTFINLDLIDDVTY